MTAPAAHDMYGGSPGDPTAAPGFAAPPFPVPFPGAFPVVPAPDARLVIQAVQHLGTRVQKLERSKGQISKDLTEMLREAQDMNKRWDSENAGAPLARATSAVASPSTAATTSVVASMTNDDLETSHSMSSILPPPGLQPDLKYSKTQPMSEQTSRRVDGPPKPLPESLQVQEKCVDGNTVYRVEWRIDNAKSKFKDCIGRPLVSPQFEAGELAELRLMVFPNIGIDASSTMRDQKSKFEAVIAEGPLRGVLKFKVVGGEGVQGGRDRLCVDFNLFVGATEIGPMKHNFAEHIIKGCDFNNDWLQEMHRGALVVGVEILKVDPRGDASDEDLTVIGETD